MSLKIVLLFCFVSLGSESKLLVKEKEPSNGERKLDLFGGPPDQALENDFQHKRSINGMRMMMTNLRLDQAEQNLLQNIDNIADVVDQIVQESEPKMVEMDEYLDNQRRSNKGE